MSNTDQRRTQESVAAAEIQRQAQETIDAAHMRIQERRDVADARAQEKAAAAEQEKKVALRRQPQSIAASVSNWTPAAVLDGRTILVGGPPVNATITIKGASPVTTGAQLAQLTIPRRYHWIDAFGVIPITNEQVMERSTFFLGRRIIGEKRVYLKIHRHDRHLSSRPMFDPIIVDEHDDYWKIFVGNIPSVIRRNVALNWFNLGSDAVPRFIQECENGVRYTIVGGPGIGLVVEESAEQEELTEQAIEDEDTPTYMSTVFGQLPRILRRVSIFLERRGIFVPSLNALARGLKVWNILSFVGRAASTVVNAIPIPERDNVAIKLCQRNKIYLEGSNLEFFYSFWALRYYMEEHSQYFFNRNIPIGSAVGETWITTSMGQDILNMAWFFNNMTPHEIDMNLIRMNGATIPWYMEVFESNLQQLMELTGLQRINGKSKENWLRLFRAYLNDYEFRVNTLDELVKVIFGGALS